MAAQAWARLVWVAGIFLTLTFSTLICPTIAEASTVIKRLHSSGGQTSPHGITHAAVKHLIGKLARGHATGGGISCVPFARAASGIALTGNAVNWWDAAEGVYERGSRPEPGSVLNFRANTHMRLGHVAVVTDVLGSREVEIEHANWSAFGTMRGDISRGIRVQDVSPSNDWSAVRVELGHSGDFGSVYPTYGFIYDRPDRGRMIANNTADRLGQTSLRPALAADEVAEAPMAHAATAGTLSIDGPPHSIH
jgi:hypothetical protein